jgi:uncharacterized protein (UPF0212 family)
MEETEKKSKKGRPKGSKSESVVVEVLPVACPKCGSTARGVYTGTNRHLFTSGVHDGVEYTSITLRRCRCAKCGQTRIEKTYNVA